MLIPKFFRISYAYFLKPILFLFNPEIVHDYFIHIGELLENQDWLVGSMFRYSNSSLHRRVLGVDFTNPIGLAAGFDYDGHLARVMKSVGFGFNTIGTVTALPYEGNPKPRLARLPKSNSLLVNKGFKSQGANKVKSRLDKKKLSSHTVGISVGSSNVPKINTISKAISDYLITFKLFMDRYYVKYFELNISCPNVCLQGAFTSVNNFTKLCQAIKKLNLTQPVFIKMPNEISFTESDHLVQIALNYGMRGFIFSNLVKNRSNPSFNKTEIARMSSFAGNFSGKPAFENSNKLISHTRKKFGKAIAIIGCGGIFTANDVNLQLQAGADLVQLITGMIFEGPQLIGEINHKLAEI